MAIRDALGDDSTAEHIAMMVAMYPCGAVPDVDKMLAGWPPATRPGTAAAPVARPAAVHRPELPVTTADGLAESVQLSGHALSVNVTAEQVECRQLPDGEWRELRGRALSELMTRCSEVATFRGEPWRIQSWRLEWRLIEAVAGRHERRGEGGPVYEAVREWAGSFRGLSVASLTAAAVEAQVLQRYEVGARAPRSVLAAVRRALEYSDWEYRTLGTGTGARKRWVNPRGERRAARFPWSSKD